MKDNRLTLRALEPEDVEMLYGLENDTDLWDVGDSTAPYSRATLRDYIATNTNDIYTDRQLRLVIDIDGKPSGCIDLFHFNPQNRRAEVGIALLPEWRGKGFGREAVTQLIAFSSRHLALVQLYALVSETNSAAQAMFLSCGFQQSGLLKSWLLRSPHPQSAIILQRLL